MASLTATRRADLTDAQWTALQRLQQAPHEPATSVEMDRIAEAMDEGLRVTGPVGSSDQRREGRELDTRTRVHHLDDPGVLTVRSRPVSGPPGRSPGPLPARPCGRRGPPLAAATPVSSP